MTIMLLINIFFDGFKGWGDKDTNNTTTYFCWEEKKFFNFEIFIGSAEYPTFKDYVNQMHQNWLYDIEDN
jgi:hypothetical protein